MESSSRRHTPSGADKKFLNVMLFVTSLVGYLEWGGGQSTMLFKAEGEIFARALQDPAGVLHPFTLLPMLGQLALIATLFQKTPSKALTYFGIAGIGLLFLLMFAIGLMSLNLRILVSTLPFLIFGAATIRAHRVPG